MLKGEDIISGTSTTGTGTLTLANTPIPPGGVDFFAWLTASGIGFANGAAVLVPYTIKEYTDNTFGTVKQTEVGWGTLTLGANLTASTLARTTVVTTVTSENTNPATYSTGTTAITIGTAANVLIMIGPRAMDALMFSPYFVPGITPAGMAPLTVGTGALPSATVSNGFDCYFPIILAKPMLIKKVTMNVSLASTGTTSAAYFRLYAVNSAGKPGQLLCDYGALGGANPLNATGDIASAVHASGFMATPGEYQCDLFPTWNTGASVQLKGNIAVYASLGPGIASAGSSTAPATANLTGYTAIGNPSATGLGVGFASS